MINYEKVDELIASHKERLQYHREFLDGSQAEKYNSPKLDIDLSVWGIRGNKDGQHKSHHYSNLPNLRSKSREGNEDFDPHRYLDLSSITKPSRARDVQLVNATSPREVGKKESLRYFTNSHNRMYERGAAWQHYKEENLNRLFEAITSEEMSECSFQPATKTQQYEEELHYSSYLSQQNQNTNGNLSGYINVGEANFIERQRIARERKEQAERRLVPDISKWKNRQTVPMEFEIGKRTGVIPALKKPCFTSGTSPATTKDTVDNVIDVSSIEKIEMKKEEKSDKQQDIPKVVEEETASRPENVSQEDIAMLQEGLRKLKEEMIMMNEHFKEQNEEISRLNKALALSQRELEVARATIRNISLT